MKSGGMNCLKYLVFFFNLLIFIAGIAALTVGIWALVHHESFKEILVGSPWVFNGIYVIIAVGALLFLIGFLGCCGAVKENRCMLGTFFVVILVLFVAQLAGAIYLYVNRGNIKQAVADTMSVYGDNSTAGTAITNGWDALQSAGKCCGDNSYTDWKNNKAWNARFSPKIVPESCCKSLTKTDIVKCQAGEKDLIYTDGCIQKLSGSMTTVAIVAAVILVVQVLAMIFSCCLYKNANNYGEIA